MNRPTNTERDSMTAENFCPDCFRDKAKVATVYRDVCSKGLRYADSGAEADCQRIADRIKAASLTRAWPSFDAWWATEVRLGSGWTTLERLAAIAAWKHLERQFAAPQPSVSAAEGDESLRQECLGLIVQRKPIEAMKLYRNRKGCTLREAKDIIDAMQEGKTS